MTDDGVYIGECQLFSSNYCGPAVSLSMQGCSLSTTVISMALKPNQQKQIIEWFCKHRRDLVEKSLSGEKNGQA